MTIGKPALRKMLRKIRADHVQTLNPATRALIFHRPPGPLLALIPNGAVIGLYSDTSDEAPTSGYARFFHEHGHRLALPTFETRASAMAFAAWDDPWGQDNDDLLSPGPFGVAQPGPAAERLIPDVVFVPLLGFTQDGARLGQGGGHYDRWSAANPAAVAIGMAWDAQLVDRLPVEPHDRAMTAVVTPTRLFGPFA